MFYLLILGPDPEIKFFGAGDRCPNKESFLKNKESFPREKDSLISEKYCLL